MQGRFFPQRVRPVLVLWIFLTLQLLTQAFFVIFSTSVFPENTVVRRRNKYVYMLGSLVTDQSSPISSLWPSRSTGMWNENPFSSRVENIIFVLRSALVPDDISVLIHC